MFANERAGQGGHSFSAYLAGKTNKQKKYGKICLSFILPLLGPRNTLTPPPPKKERNMGKASGDYLTTGGVNSGTSTSAMAMMICFLLLISTSSLEWKCKRDEGSFAVRSVSKYIVLKLMTITVDKGKS